LKRKIVTSGRSVDAASMIPIHMGMLDNTPTESLTPKADRTTSVPSTLNFAIGQNRVTAMRTVTMRRYRL
jgi:hypothetical protein